MRRVFMAAAALAGAVLVILVIAEALIRGFLPQWSDQWKMWRIDPVYARGLEPGVQGAIIHGHSQEFAFRFSTNAEGLRMDEDLNMANEEQAERFVLVGDSFTFGYGVEQDETFAAQWQRLLELDSKNAQIINAGFASGFTLDTEYLFTREVAANWRPAKVVVGVCLDNDLGDLGLNLWTIENGRLSSIRKNNDFVPVWIKMSGLVNFLVKGAFPRVQAFFASKPSPNGADFATGRIAACDLPIPVPANLRAIGVVGDSLKQGREDATSAAAASPAERVEWLMHAFQKHASDLDYDLTIMLIPSANEVQWPSSKAALANLATTRAIFAGAARQAGIRVLDPVEQMRRHWCETGEALYFKRDGHWNASGHRFIANWLHESLVEVADSAEHQAAPQFAH